MSHLTSIKMQGLRKRYVDMEYGDASVDGWSDDDDDVDTAPSGDRQRPNRASRRQPQPDPYTRNDGRDNQTGYSRRGGSTGNQTIASGYGRGENESQQINYNQAYLKRRSQILDVSTERLKQDTNSLYRNKNSLYSNNNNTEKFDRNKQAENSDEPGDEPELSGSDDNYFDDNDDMERQPMGQTGAHAGKLVTFYRNGDENYKGVPTSVSKKHFPTFESLLVWLTKRIETTSGVRHVFALPSGKEVKEIHEFVAGKSYVVSSSSVVSKSTTYGVSREVFWKNKRPSAGPFRKSEQDLFFPKSKKGIKSNSYPSSRAGSLRSMPGTLPMAVKPRMLTIVSNTNRNSFSKVLFNPKTVQTFEDMLKTTEEMLDIQFKPVQTLYTLKKPQKQIKSYSHLSRLPKTVEEFLVCGREMFPLELQHDGTGEEEPVELPLPKGFQQPTQERDKLASKRDLPSKPRTPRERQSDSNISYYNDGMTNGDSFDTKDHAIDGDRYSPRHDVRPPRDYSRLPGPPSWSQEGLNNSRSKVALPKTDKPYRKKLPELESVKVHIHGKLIEFFVPRYGLTDNDGSKSERNIELNWVYGYRGLDGRNNLYSLPTGELLYYVAGVAVVYNRQLDRQRHYQEHNEDITCMAINLSGNSVLVATGQAAGKTVTNCAHVRIWDPYTLVTRCVIGTNHFQMPVAAVSFSGPVADLDNSSLLLTIDDSSKHTLSVWDWKKGRIIGKTSTTADSVVWGTFHPRDHTTVITYGKQHVYFWKLFWNTKQDTSAKILRDKKSGLMPMDDQPRFVTSVCFAPNGDVLTGDSNGCITVWTKDASDAYVTNLRCSEATKHAHSKSIFALCMNADGTLFSGAGSEIKAWDSTNNYRMIKERVIPEGCGGIRTLIQQNVGSTDGALYLGTTSNSIMEGSLQEKFTTIVQGHSEELWAVATHPDEQMFVTAGYDQYVCKWDMQSHRPIWKTFIEKPGLSVAFDPFGRLVLVGTTLGRFIVLEAYSGMHMASVQVSQEALDGIKFSPDGHLVAMGSHDCHVYVYEVLEEGQAFKKHRGGVLRGHNKFVNHLDWSKDGKYLQTVCGDYDLLFWDISTMKEMPAQLMRETDWDTQTCVLNYNVLGAWSNLKDGEDITTLCRNGQGDEVAVGDNVGTIRTYKFPCTAERPEYHLHKKYGGKINKVVYSHNDRFLVTSGGTDAGLMQWAVVEEGDYL